MRVARPQLRILLPACALAVALGSGGCDRRSNSGWTSDPLLAETPQGERPLMALDDTQVADTIAWAGMEIDEWRAEGVLLLIAALKADLAARGIQTAALDKITPAHIGQPLPRRDIGTDDGSTSNGLGQKRAALAEPGLQQYFSCPIYAPENNQGTACDQLVQGAVAKVASDIEQNKGNVAGAVNADYAELPDVSRAFIAAWGDEAMKYGAKVAAVYAAAELRAANQCDDKAHALTVSYTLGIEQGISIVEERRAWAIEQVKSCIINTDHIAEQVRQTSKSTVVTFMEQHKVCLEADLAESNQSLKEAEAKRKEGILSGIDQRVEILRQELFEERRKVGCCDITGQVVSTTTTATPPPPAPSCDIGGSCRLVSSDRNIGWQDVLGNCVCCRYRRATGLLACKGDGQQPVYCGENRDKSRFCQCAAIPLGSPVVIDLDDDGLTLSQELVSFDLLAAGEAQRSTWVGPREGLLAIDLDGDGAIGSSAELFGNRSDCGARSCYDGPAALKFWDSTERGGNGDGMIDARDRVFARLGVWVDANQDGTSQAGELQPLAAHGIVAINLDAGYEVERRPEGSITSQLEVLTEGGFRRAYDVWFRLKLTTGQLTSMMPLTD